MSEALFVAMLQVVGAVFAAAVVRDVGRLGAAIMGLPLGMALYGLATAALLTMRIPFHSLGALAVVGVLTVAWGIAAVGGRGLRRFAPTLGVAAAVAVAGSALFQVLHLTRVTADSFRYLALAGIISETGELAAATPGLLRTRSLLAAVPHTGPGASDTLYLASIMPLLGLAGLATFTWLAWRTLRERGWSSTVVILVVASAGAFLLSTDRLVFNLFYLNVHLLIGVYAMLMVAALWLRSQGHPPGWTAVAAVTAAALVVSRPEGPLLAALLAVPGLTSLRIPLRERWAVALAIAATCVGWYAIRLAPLLDDGLREDLVLGALVAATGVVGLAAASSWSATRRVTAHAPLLVFLALVVLLGVLAANDPAIAETAVRASWENVTGRGLWRGTWLIVPVLFLLALAVSRLPAPQFWTFPILAFPVFLLALGLLRGTGYRVGPGDSGNRMLAHILLVSVLFIVMSVGWGDGRGLLRSRSRRIDAPGHAAVGRTTARNSYEERCGTVGPDFRPGG